MALCSTWTVDAVNRFLDRHGRGSKARLALLTALNTGMARQNPCHADGHMRSVINGKLRIADARGKASVAADMPVFPNLKKEIAALPMD
ncbi:hypothetical protein [Roseicitreum antarcticum]|uniref:hypothetical protein n=1 Tax=Roseicitreum antarcticum TaxID=564137 RepID=UPI00115F9292|nr:hypothetical protein [Roseicitreum antarcticum]